MGQVSAQAEPEQSLHDLFAFQASNPGTGALIAGPPWTLGPLQAEAPVDRLVPSSAPTAAEAGAITAALVISGLLDVARVIPWWLFALVIALGVVIMS